MKPHDTLPYTELPDYSDAERIARSRAFYDTIKTRRTCRHFSDESIPRAVIENAILAAGTAPNGANHQPWHFAVIETPAKKRPCVPRPKRKSVPFTRARAATNGWRRWRRSVPTPTSNFSKRLPI